MTTPTLCIPFRHVDVAALDSYGVWAKVFEGEEVHLIGQASWREEFPYTPDASFQILHTDDHVVLHYLIEEEDIKAVHTRTNEAVWEDSCVEFFVSFDQGEHYFNVEFNVLGAGLIGFGSVDKPSRRRLSEEVVAQVSTFTTVRNVRSQKSWGLVLVLPAEILLQGATSLRGIDASANFYKCGDKLPKPHFLSWSSIDFPKPNFHLPQFFGKIKFE